MTLSKASIQSTTLRHIGFAAAASSLLFLSACNDSSTDAPAEEENAVTTNTIVDIASSDDRFETLTAAVVAAGLAETLSGEGPFTVFAPTDDAFAALPAGTVEALLATPEGDLKDILLYHVVSGKVTADQVVTLTNATSLLGEDITIEVRDGSVYLNGTTKVVITDIMADNGVIHVIDAVILPPAEDTVAEPLPSIVGIASNDERFETLTAAVVAAGLAPTLDGEGSFTVFAPTDDAFAALPAGTLEALLADPMGDLKNILLYHVVSGSVGSEQVVALSSATSLEGSDISIAIVEGKVILNGNAEVIITDIPASNGVIHVIDAVILPPAN